MLFAAKTNFFNAEIRQATGAWKIPSGLFSRKERETHSSTQVSPLPHKVSPSAFSAVASVMRETSSGFWVDRYDGASHGPPSILFIFHMVLIISCTPPNPCGGVANNLFDTITAPAVLDTHFLPGGACRGVNTVEGVVLCRCSVISGPIL